MTNIYKFKIFFLFFIGFSLRCYSQATYITGLPVSGQFCLNDAPVRLEGFSPSGKLFSGPGVTNIPDSIGKAWFNPATAGTGTHTINYFSNYSATVTVSNYPATTLAPFAPVCVNVPPFALTGGLPAGGVYSGTGVDAFGNFTPVVGSHAITYTMTVGTCVSSATQNITVYPLPVVVLNDFSPVCIDKPSFALSGGNPFGGTYTGPNVAGGIFTPTVTGTFTITYTYSNTNCINSISKNLVVNPVPVVGISGLDAKYCSSDAPVTVTGTPTDAGGNFTGQGITDNGDGTAVFNPATAGLGTHSIAYTYIDVNGCENSISQSVQVGTPITITGLQPSYCVNSAATTIAGNPLGGNFSVIAGLINNGDGTATFNPSLAGAGTHNIVYTFLDATGCTNVVTNSVMINPLPTPAITGFKSEYCINDPPALISGSYAPGGIFTGNVIDNGNGTATYNPSSFPAGGPYIATYTYTNPVTGCTNSVTSQTSINPVPTATISGNATVCEGNSTPLTIALTGEQPYNLTYSNGTSSFTVTGHATNTFNTNVTPVSNVIFTVTSVTDAKGCNNSGTGNALINFNPKVIIATQPISHSVCPNSNTNLIMVANGINITYQWRKNGLPIAGKTSSILDLNNVGAGDVAAYSCEVSSTCGGPVISNNADISLYTPTAITVHPMNTYLCEGDNLNLQVVATGSNLTYQWRKDGASLANGGNISGATNSTITITGVDAGNAGNYTCVVSGSCGIIESNAANVKIDEKIVITAQPTGLNACPLDNISFSVLATGTNLIYRWQKNGFDIPGETSQSLVINGISAADAGSYRCIISSGCGQSVISSPALLTVNNTTVITSHPANATVCAGGNVNFSVSASGTNLSYQWKKEGINVIDGGSISGATTDKLIINNSVLANAGSYTCLVTGSCGILNSNPAVLTVDNAINITTQPQNITACPGNNINFTLVATGSNLTYQWKKNSIDLPGKTNPSLSLNGITGADAGDYLCVIQNSCGATLISSVAKLALNNPTVIITDPVGTTKCLGDNVSFEVSATGTGLTYQWKKNGTDLANGGNISGSTSNSLYITSLVNNDAGSYTCTITGSCGTLNSNPAQLVIDANISIISQPQNAIACDGDNDSFSVVASGSNLTYQWQKNNVDIAGATSQTITLNSVTVANAGLYRCILRNSCGANVISSVATLTINADETITAQPADVLACSGTNSSFTVLATGTNLQYQWFKNNVILNNGGAISGATTNTLVINAISAANTGVYSCRITGSCDIIYSNPASLTINENAVITGQPQNLTICEGNNANFTTLATGTNLQYQWQKNGVDIPGQTNAGLLVNNITIADAGLYRCIVTGDCNSITSNGASLTINPSVVITNQPANLELCSGSNAGFTINATGSNLTYQWKLNGSNLTDGGNVSGSNTGSLSISSVNNLNAGLYTCNITNICGTSATNPASLVINDNTVILTEPQNLSLCPGNNANFNVTASGTSLTYQWKKDGVDIAGETNSGFIINNVSSTDVGIYRCTVSGTCGQITSNGASLATLSAPVISVQPDNKTVCSGSSAGFTLSASGSALTYQWKLNGTDLVEGLNVSGSNSASLTINPANENDAGVIACQVAGTCGSVLSNTTNLLVNPSTVITAHPQNQVACINGNASFSVLATGSNLTYQWQKDGANLIGETSAGILVNNVSTANAGVYRCIVSGDCGNQISNGALLTVNNDITITSHPANIEICSGTNAAFKVNVSGPVSAYQWKFNGAPLTNGGKISGALTGNLSINTASSLNAGVYVCEITGSCGTLNSNPATLTIDENITITSHPVNVTACPGENANFSVLATGTNLTYQWQKDGVNLAGQTGTNLVLTGVAAVNAGVYRCVISGDCGQKVSNGALLQIDNGISMTLQPATTVNICAENNFNLKVTATGSSLTYQWVKNGQNLVNGGNISGATTDNLIINGIGIADQGVYNCKIMSTCGFVNSDFSNVTVYPATFVIQHPAHFSVVEGGNATFSVLAEGGNLSYQWEKNGTALIDGGKISGSTTSLLSITGVAEADEGAYRCVITGSCGPINSNPANLTVNQNSIITSQPLNLTKCEGESAGFSVLASGTSLTYQWKKNGVDLTDNGNVSGSKTFNLTINVVNLTDAGAYTCLVNSEISSPALLQVNKLTTITNHPVAAAKCNGDIATFSVVTTGTSLTYQWQKNNINLTDGGDIIGSMTNVLNISNVSDAYEGTYRCIVTGSCGTSNSNAATLIVNSNTQITLQPLNKVVCQGESVVLTLGANGDGLTYQWKKDGADLSDAGNISGSQSANLIIANSTPENSGNYTCFVTGICGEENSIISQVTVNPSTNISTHPFSLTACTGDNATFSVIAAGSSLTYQWQKGGINISDGGTISGTTTPVLAITGVTSADLGAYRCIVTGTCGTANSNVALLNSYEKTAITNQPIGSSLCEGQPLSLNIQATGNYLLYQWQKDGINLSDGGNISGAKTSNLIISNATLSNYGFYSCLVSGSCGNENSNLAEVIINPVTVVTTHPVNINLCANDFAGFTILAAGKNLIYQWKKNGVNLSNGGTVSGVNTNVLSINGAVTADAGAYTCLVNGTCNSATSNPAVLQISQNTVINSQPAGKTMCEGESVVLSVGVSGDNLVYQWKRNGIALTNSGNVTGTTTSNLSISNVTLNDAGDYTCTVSGNCGTVNTNSAVLTINQGVGVTLQPVSSTRCAGDNTGFLITAKGSSITYQWQKDGVNLMDDSQVVGTTTQLLTISGITTANNGTYRCEITGTCGTALSDPAILSALPTTDITLQPEDDSICSGESASFSIIANGNSNIYQWKKDGINLIDAGNVSGSNSSILNINAGISTNAGIYTCVVSGTCGSENSSPARLVVSTNTVILSHPANQSKCKGDIAVFSVSATGQNLTYKWEKNGIALSDGGNTFGSSSPVLTVNDLNVVDAGAYRCIVTGKCGTAFSDAANLTVNVYPDAAGTITGPTSVCQGDTGVIYEILSIANAESYLWSVPVGTTVTSAQNTRLIKVAFANFEAGGTITVTGINGCGTGPTSPVLTVLANPLPVAYAGEDRNLCASNIVLEGNNPGSGNGQWSVINGPAAIANQNQYNSTVNNLRQGENILTWKVLQNGCSSIDTVRLYNNIITVEAGENKTVCDDAILLNGSIVPAGAVGSWTVMKGSASFVNGTLPNTLVSGFAPGKNKLKWSVTKAGCINYDTIEVDNQRPSTSYAGIDQLLCRDTTVLSATNPLIGTGKWTIVTGTALFNKDNQNNTKITSIGQGDNIFRWTVSNGICSSIDEVTISNNKVSANAGIDQVLCDRTTTLAAVQPLTGIGNWSVISGSAIFMDVNQFDTKVTGLNKGTNFLRWTVNKNNCLSSDTVTLVNDAPSQSDAGDDQIIMTNYTTLQGNIPEVGTGEWFLISGSAVFANPNQFNTTVSGLNIGVNTFRWTITNNSCSSSDDVTVTNYTPNTTNAGDDQTLCIDNTYLEGNEPVFGFGEWSVVKGSATFQSNSEPNTKVTGLSKGENILRWTVWENGYTSDDVVIINNSPSIAEAGFNQVLCADSANLFANLPFYGTGTWSVVGGSGTFSDSSSYISKVTKLAPGENKLKWTITNQGCSSTDIVIINNGMPTTAIAGNDISTCTGSAGLYPNMPSVGTGSWSVVSGSGIFNGNLVSNLAKDINILRWTISTTTCASSDDVMVTNNKPSTALAGADKTICYDSITLAANNPVTGTGLWTIQNGSAVFQNITKGNSKITSIAKGQNVFRWTVTYNGCSSYDEVSIKNDLVNAWVGPDQVLCGTSTILEAYSPEQGTGSWSVVGGSGSATFENPGQADTRVTGLDQGTNILRWSIQNSICYSFADVKIINNMPTTANAGPDQSLCKDSTMLKGNTPAIGTGVWIVLGGSGIVESLNKPDSKVTKLKNGVNTLRWTITNQGCISSDEVVLNNDSPTLSFAGDNQELCSDSTTLYGNNPAYGTGSWTIVSGSALFDNNQNYNTKVRNLGKGTNTLKWTVINKGCSSIDEVIITNNIPSQAVAGSDQVICGDVTMLNSNIPLIGSGEWILISGSAEFSDKYSNSTMTSALNAGTNVLRWNITNAGCVTYDEVIITNDLPVVSDAGPDMEICSNYTQLFANNPQGGTGSWQVISGSATFIDPSNYNTTVTNLGFGQNTLIWNIDFDQCSTYDELIITNNSTDIYAGVDQTIGKSHTILAANNPSVGSGSWTITGGSGYFKEALNFLTEVTNLGPGKNTFRWSVNINGCISYDEISITYNVPPVASFIANKYEGCPPLEVYFVNNSLDNLPFEWNFGDNTNSTEVTVSHIYTDPGIYKVVLTVTGNAGELISKDTTIYVYDQPVASFEMASTEVFIPDQPAIFINKSQSAEKYLWEFGDTATSTERDPWHNYFTEGNYDVTLHIWSDQLCKDSVTLTSVVQIIQSGTIRFPNAFSPDLNGPNGGYYSSNDYSNNVFYPIGEGIENYHLEIFNKWGILIFESKDISIGWDGYYKGELLKEGVYIWKITGTFNNGKPFNKLGTVMLVH